MYLCYLFQFGRPTQRLVMNCESDSAARSAGESLLLASHAHAVQVWEGIRLVHHTGGHCAESGPFTWEAAPAALAS